MDPRLAALARAMEFARFPRVVTVVAILTSPRRMLQHVVARARRWDR